MGEALGKFRSGVGLGRKGREGWSAAQQQEGGRYGGVGQPMPRHLPYPASTDDEVFTLVRGKGMGGGAGGNRGQWQG